MKKPEQPQQLHQQQSIWFIKLLSMQSNIISDCLLALLSPFLSILSLASQTPHRIDKETFESPAAPLTVEKYRGGSGGSFLRKVVSGFLGAAYVCILLTAVMVVSFIIGVSLVRMYVEEPVYLREKLHLDYTDIHPNAVVPFYGGKFMPVGHTFYVRLVFLMPDSDYNREIGNFQVIASVISTDGEVLATSSRPCMLRFQSLPVRLMRTFLMGIPLLLGISSETQIMSVMILKHKEIRRPRTDHVRIYLVPRAGTSFLPQIYEAEVVVNSELPWLKELVRRWKWTFYVWTSLYVYISSVALLVSCFRSVMFRRLAVPPVSDESQEVVQDDSTVTEDRPAGQVAGGRDRLEISEVLRRWKQNRSKRKAMLMQTSLISDVSSISVTREDISGMTSAEEIGDSESFCH